MTFCRLLVTRTRPPRVHPGEVKIRHHGVTRTGAGTRLIGVVQSELAVHPGLVQVHQTARNSTPDEWVATADDLVSALFTEQAGPLVKLARFFVDDYTAAEDLVQEAFIRLARSAHRIRDRASATAYLRAIVLNLARDHNRRGLVSIRHRPPSDPMPPSVEEQVTGREDQRRIVEALRELPRRQRDCLVLRYYLELPVLEIAGTLGLSANSVKTHLQRGLKAMQARLEGTR